MWLKSWEALGGAIAFSAWFSRTQGIDSQSFVEIRVVLYRTRTRGCMERIAVVGTPSSGKTTLARNISQRLSILHIELDALHWEPNWSKSSTDVFCSRVTQALSSDR